MKGKVWVSSIDLNVLTLTETKLGVTKNHVHHGSDVLN